MCRCENVEMKQPEIIQHSKVKIQKGDADNQVVLSSIAFDISTRPLR